MVKNEELSHLTSSEIASFNHRMDKIYNVLHDNVIPQKFRSEYAAAIDAFDEFNCPTLVGQITNARHDYISSDRECAAFMFTLAEKYPDLEIPVDWQPQTLQSLIGAPEWCSVISYDDALKIINKREPIGRYIIVQQEHYIGLHNFNPRPQMEIFTNLKDCINWLDPERGERGVPDRGVWPSQEPEQSEPSYDDFEEWER